MTINWGRLTEPFPPTDIEWRLAQSGKNAKGVWAKVLAYLTARAIQDRLDEVFGVGGWKNEFRAGPAGGVVCRIYFQNDQNEWVWREDGAENTDIEAVKGGLSGSLKRAGAALGIGRYLYDLDEFWAEITESGANYVPKNDKKDLPAFRWNPPKLPAWAMPSVARGAGTNVHPDEDHRKAATAVEPAPAPSGATKRANLTQKNVNALLKKAGSPEALEAAVSRALGGTLIQPVTDAKLWPEMDANDHDRIMKEIALGQMPPAVDADTRSLETLLDDATKAPAERRKAIHDAANKKLISMTLLRNFVGLATMGRESELAKVTDDDELAAIMKAVEGWA